MEEFSTRQRIMFASFDLSVEEQAIFDRYYKFLDESGVAEIIKRAIQNDTQKGGRPNVNYFNLFAAVLYPRKGKNSVQNYIIYKFKQAKLV